jgi:CRISPR locus-related DNA-binding protein
MLISLNMIIMIILLIMKNLRVHIAPVGFEVKRVTYPLIKMRADKVYLVTYKPNDNAKKYFESIKEELKKEDERIEIEEVYVNIWDLFDCIEKFREIFEKEKEQSNQIYFNVSTGSKITAMAGMLVCMIIGGQPYYAKKDYSKSGTEKEEIQDIVMLPVLEIRKPKDEHLIVLSIIDKAGGRMRKRELIQELVKLKIIRPKENSKLTVAAKHSQLRAILYPLEKEWGYVKVEYSGRRSEVILTQQGKSALRIFGVPHKIG